MAQLTSLETTPKTVTQALKDPKWRHAMDFEFNALMKNSTWDLVPPYCAENVISTKWVFRLKRDSKGCIVQHKAHLVARGFDQREG